MQRPVSEVAGVAQTSLRAQRAAWEPGKHNSAQKCPCSGLASALFAIGGWARSWATTLLQYGAGCHPKAKDVLSAGAFLPVYWPRSRVPAYRCRSSPFPPQPLQRFATAPVLPNDEEMTSALELSGNGALTAGPDQLFRDRRYCRSSSSDGQRRQCTFCPAV
jgi:hypothetical protein